MGDFPRCKTCRHWLKDQKYMSWETADLGLGKCAATLFLEDVWDYDRERQAKVLSKEAAGVTAFALDASGCSAHMYTLPEHGCTMHSDLKPELRPWG